MRDRPDARARGEPQQEHAAVDAKSVEDHRQLVAPERENAHGREGDARDRDVSAAVQALPEYREPRFLRSTGFQPVPSRAARVENPCYVKCVGNCEANAATIAP